MARPLDGAETEPEVDRREERVISSTARAFAAAVAALLVTTFVISRSSELETPQASASNRVRSGTLELTDDDEGESLFDLGAMIPGTGSTQCIEVAYTGSILPVEVTLLAKGDGALSDYLNVTVDQGDGAGFEDCTGFTSTGTVFDGTLAELATKRIAVGTIYNQGDTQSFRFTFALADTEEALGLEAWADFYWEVSPP